MQTENNKFLRIEEVMNKTALKRSTIYQLISKGDFPPSIALTANSVAWLESEVNEWMKARIAQRKQRKEQSQC